MNNYKTEREMAKEAELEKAKVAGGFTVLAGGWEQGQASQRRGHLS